MYAKYEKFLSLPQAAAGAIGGLIIALMWLLSPLAWYGALGLAGLLVVWLNLERLILILDDFGVRPSLVSFIGAAVGLACFIPLSLGWLTGGLLLAALSGLLDVLDGRLARFGPGQTARGELLDSTLDRISDGALLAGLALWLAAQGRAWWAGIALAGLVGTNLVSYVRAKAEIRLPDCAVGWGGERPDRMLALIFFGLIGLIEIGLVYTALFTWLTAGRRLWWAWKRI